MKIRYGNKIKYNNRDNYQNIYDIAKNIWINSFDDNIEQTNFFFENKFNPEYFLILELEKEKEKEKEKKLPNNELLDNNLLDNNLKNSNSLIVSSLYEIPKKLQLNEKSLDTIFLVGIETDINYRKQGYMENLLLASLQNSISSNLNIDIVFLVPVNPNIYRKFGFEYFTALNFFEFDRSALNNFKEINEFTSIKMTDENFNSLYPDFLAVYNEYMKDQLVSLKRDKFLIKDFFVENQVENKNIYIFYREKSPTGYIILGENLIEKNNKLEVREFFSLTFESASFMFYFLKNYERNINIIKIAAPINSNLNFYMSNQLEISKSETPFAMARILNPSNILKNLSLSSENFNISFYIEDKIFSQNTGYYDLCGNFLKNSKNCDFKIDISHLPMLLFGFFDFEELIKLNIVDLVALHKLPLLSKIFIKKSSYIYEYY